MNGNQSFSKILDQSGPVDEEKAEDWKVQLDSCHFKKQNKTGNIKEMVSCQEIIFLFISLKANIS